MLPRQFQATNSENGLLKKKYGKAMQILHSIAGTARLMVVCGFMSNFVRGSYNRVRPESHTWGYPEGHSKSLLNHRPKSVIAKNSISGTYTVLQVHVLTIQTSAKV